MILSNLIDDHASYDVNLIDFKFNGSIDSLSLDYQVIKTLFKANNIFNRYHGHSIFSSNHINSTITTQY